ncbi:hypothetical protein [Jeotgalibaca porci]|uniref:hypothetical protein n=1 Tax=Jeotgalibaca porci TaxID=1868793 RepID=UPI00359FDC39
MEVLASLVFLFGSALNLGISSLLLVRVIINRENKERSENLYSYAILSFIIAVAGSFISLDYFEPKIIILWSVQSLLLISVYFLYLKRGIKLKFDLNDFKPKEKNEQIKELSYRLEQNDEEHSSKYRQLNSSFVNNPEKYKERDAERDKQIEIKRKKEQEALADQEEIRKQEELIQAAVNQRFQQMQQPPVKRKEAGLFYQGVFCPNCRGLDVQFMQNKRKKFSVGKAVVGGALAGGIGAAAGLAGKKGKKNQWRCNDCGETFYSKK